MSEWSDEGGREGGVEGRVVGESWNQRTSCVLSA